MRIRTRLIVWYALLLLAGYALLAGWAYYELSVEHPEMASVLMAHQHTPLEEIGEIFLWGGVPALLIALGGGWFLMSRALMPITRLTCAIERTHADNLHQRLPIEDSKDELGRLTAVFNDMRERLDDTFTRVREFSLHASHELRTPLTVMRHELDSALDNSSLSATERERCMALLDEVQRLTQIVDGLSFLTRSDAGLLALEKAPVRLDELVRDAADDAVVLADPAGIDVRLGECASVEVLGDRRRLRQLLLILSDNAVKYNHRGGHITLSLTRDKGSAKLQVANTGGGIPQHMLGRVFERFYRGEASHDHRIEGCGLGLSIAQSIVRMHGGTISVTSEPQKQTTFSITLPCTEPSLVSETAATSQPHRELQSV